MNNPLHILQTLDRHLSRARVPVAPEIRELFLAAHPKVLALVSTQTP